MRRRLLRRRPEGLIERRRRRRVRARERVVRDAHAQPERAAPRIARHEAPEVDGRLRDERACAPVRGQAGAERAHRQRVQHARQLDAAARPALPEQGRDGGGRGDGEGGAGAEGGRVVRRGRAGPRVGRLGRDGGAEEAREEGGEGGGEVGGEDGEEEEGPGDGEGHGELDGGQKRRGGWGEDGVGGGGGGEGGVAQGVEEGAVEEEGGGAVAVGVRVGEEDPACVGIGVVGDGDDDDFPWGNAVDVGEQLVVRVAKTRLQGFELCMHAGVRWLNGLEKFNMIREVEGRGPDEFRGFGLFALDSGAEHGVRRDAMLQGGIEGLFVEVKAIGHGIAAGDNESTVVAQRMAHNTTSFAGTWPPIRMLLPGA